jgi:hypothetical protein
VGLSDQEDSLDRLIADHWPTLPLLDAMPPELAGTWSPTGECSNQFVSFSDQDRLVRTPESDRMVPKQIAGYSASHNEIIVLFADGETEFIRLQDGGYIVIARGQTGKKIHFIPSDERIVMRPCGNDKIRSFDGARSAADAGDVTGASDSSDSHP